MKRQKEEFGVRYDVSSTKKRNFVLPRGAERPKRDFSCFCATRKDQMKVFRASAWRGKAKKRFFMLPRDAERPNGGFSCFRVARKDQMEIFHASAWRGKTKKRF